MYIAGFYNGTPTIKDQSNNSLGTLPVSVGGFNTAFTCKFDASGTYQYSRIIEASNADIGYGVACDSTNNMYFTGLYTGTPNIIYVSSSNVATTVATLPASINEACFVSKFDSSGNYNYSRVIDVTGIDAGRGVACDITGNMYIAGQYAGTTVIKNEIGSSMGTLPTSAGGIGAFLLKFNSDGGYAV
jgi:hypothetical protein